MVESEWRRLGFTSWTQIEQVAKERTKWKELTCGLTPPPPSLRCYKDDDDEIIVVPQKEVQEIMAIR